MEGDKPMIEPDKLLEKMGKADGFCVFVCYNHKGRLTWDFVTKHWSKADLPWAAKHLREIAVREMESL